MVEGLIPSMNLKCAVFCLKELQRLKKEDRSRPSRELLFDYCVYLIARNLPKLLRSEKRQLFDLEYQTTR